MHGAFLLAGPNHRVERLTDGLRSPVGDKGSAPRIGLHQAFLPESLNRFTDGRSAYTEALSEFTFRRQLVARFELTFQNGLFDLLNNQFIKARRLYCTVQGFITQMRYHFIRHLAAAPKLAIWSDHYTTSYSLPTPTEFLEDRHANKTAKKCAFPRTLARPPYYRSRGSSQDRAS